MARRRRARCDAGGHAVDSIEVLIVDLVDAQRTLLHHSGVVVVFARAVRAGPRAELAPDAEVLVDQNDTVLGALIARTGGAHGDAGRLLAVQARAREVHGSTATGFARLEAMNAVEPNAERIAAIGVEIGQGRGDAA